MLKCSQTFNVLDARGAISTTERARAFTRMRDLAHQVARLWVERRDELDHPLGKAATAAASADPATAFPQIEVPARLVFEIGVEELPPREVARVAEAVRAALDAKLAATRLRHGDITVISSPRRIAALVEEIQPCEDDAQETVRGPRLSAAFDAKGNPTKAAHGFARAQGMTPAELQPVDVNGGQYAGFVRHVPGRPAAEVLAGMLPEIVTGLRADKNMRWSAPGLSYSRPIRWVLALLGEHVVPFSVAGMSAGRTTQVHRTAAEPAMDIVSATAYLDTLRALGIEPDADLRRERIITGAGDLAARVDGQIDPDGESALIEEITNLVEEPTPILGVFNPDYLKLPPEILTTVMKKHQRYLPVRDQRGRLLPHFIAVANGECDHDAVQAGNEAVLRARYEDASFFYRNDLRTPPEQMKQGLAKLTFEEQLGSMADRAARISSIATELADRAGLLVGETAVLARAGKLAKFDLGSQMVVELSSLAGVMAREYARQAGEADAVAEALFETELPRHAGDALPQTGPGTLLALADRFDLLAGLFAIGSAPTGSSDPFGMRRAALGIMNVLRAHPDFEALTVDDGLAVAAEHQPVPVDRLDSQGGGRIHQPPLRTAHAGGWPPDREHPRHRRAHLRPRPGRTNPPSARRPHPNSSLRRPGRGPAARPPDRPSRHSRTLRPCTVHHRRRTRPCGSVRTNQASNWRSPRSRYLLREGERYRRSHQRLLRHRPRHGRRPCHQDKPPRSPGQCRCLQRQRPHLARTQLTTGGHAARPATAVMSPDPYVACYGVTLITPVMLGTSCQAKTKEGFAADDFTRVPQLVVTRP